MRHSPHKGFMTPLLLPCWIQISPQNYMPLRLHISPYAYRNYEQRCADMYLCFYSYADVVSGKKPISIIDCMYSSRLCFKFQLVHVTSLHFFMH